MSKKFNLFFVESPLQLLSATQARQTLNIGNTIIFISVSDINSNNYKQMLNLLDDKWDKVHFIKRNNRYLDALLFLMNLVRFYFNFNNKVERFLYGEYRSLDFAVFESIISPKESILLDDGAVTIAMQQNFINKGRCIFKEQSGIRARTFRRLVSHCRNPNLFSFFDFDNCLLPGQVNYYIKEEVLQIKSVKNSCFFIGSKFSEAGYMKENDELHVLREVIHNSELKNIFYIPHREESKEKLNKISSLGYKIKNLNKPLELYFNTTKEMPEKVISYYSTALYSCHLTFGSQIEIEAVDIRTYLTSKVSLENVDLVYNYYFDRGITIRQL